MEKISNLRANLQRLGHLEQQRAKLEESLVQEENELQASVSSIVVGLKEVDIFEYKKAVRALLEIWTVGGSDEVYEQKVRAIVGNWVSYFQTEVEEYDE